MKQPFAAVRAYASLRAFVACSRRSLQSRWWSRALCLVPGVCGRVGAGAALALRCASSCSPALSALGQGEELRKMSGTNPEQMCQ